MPWPWTLFATGPCQYLVQELRWSPGGRSLFESWGSGNRSAESFNVHLHFLETMDVLGQTCSPWAAALASWKEHGDLKMRWGKKRQNTHFCLLPLRESSCTSGKDCRSYYQLKLVREELLIFWVLSFSVHLQMSLTLQSEGNLQTSK